MECKKDLYKYYRRVGGKRGGRNFHKNMGVIMSGAAARTGEFKENKIRNYRKWVLYEAFIITENTILDVKIEEH